MTGTKRGVLKALARSLLLASGLVGSFVYGFVVHRQRLFPYEFVVDAYQRVLSSDTLASLYYRLLRPKTPRGRWARSQADSSAPQAHELEKLAAVGYLSGTTKARNDGVVIRHDASRTAPGLNLYCSGHAPEAILMDMDGKVLHRWGISYKEAFPNDPIESRDIRADFWRRVYLYENGDLLAIFEGLGIIKIDKDSHLLWANHNASHHAIYVDKGGEIYSLTRTPHIVTTVNDHRPILEDFIAVLGPDGAERRRYSVLEAVQNSDYASLLTYSKGYGDLFHTNAIQLLDGREEHLSPLFRAGNALISLPAINALAVVALPTNRVVWAMAGLFRFQHDPILLENGDLLVFDNFGRKGQSRVLQLDWLTQEIRWLYPRDATTPFFTDSCGSSMRLSNGNTLITESERGRAIEVTPDNAIVWEFNSPHRAGAGHELVATLMEMRRLEGGINREWLNGNR